MPKGQLSFSATLQNSTSRVFSLVSYNYGFIFIGDVDSDGTKRFEQQLQIEAGDTLYAWYNVLEDVMTFIELHNRGIRVVLVKRTAVTEGWALTTLEIANNSNNNEDSGS